MTISRKFSKYHGAGNDFLLFEDFEESFPDKQVANLCDRKVGIGADGLILARFAKQADFEMVFFNSDGKKGAMCGNGLRCFVHFLRDLGHLQESYCIEIARKFLTVKIEEGKIVTFIPTPTRSLEETGEIYLVDTGVPHVVVFVDQKVDVQREGAKIRQMYDANANFVWEKAEDAFFVRTFERGVEGETLACGTGAAAVAFVAHKTGRVKKDVEIETRSGESLHVHVGEELEIIGPSLKVFEGVVDLELCLVF